MNIGIFGVGCIGSVLSKYLVQKLTHHVFFYNRSPKEELLISYKEDELIIPVVLEKDESVELDWLIVCVKHYHLAAALSRIEKLVRRQTKLAIFRNGLNQAEDFHGFVSLENILETTIDCPTQKMDNGAYHQLKKPSITLPDNALAEEFKNLFKGSEVELRLSTDFKMEQWKKLIESSSLGSIQALTKEPCSIFRVQRYKAVYARLIIENIRVAQSEGIQIELSYVDTLLEKLKSYPETKGSSMLSDVLSGRQLELDAKIGAILKLGLKNKLDLPLTQKIYQALLNQE